MLSEEITDQEARAIDARERSEMKTRHAIEMAAASKNANALRAKGVMNNIDGECGIRHAIEKGVLVKAQ